MRVERILQRKPWLLPFLLAMTTNNIMIGAKQLGEKVGVKTRVARRALWLLRKYGVIDDHSKDQVKRWLISQKIWVRDRKLAWKYGKEYLLIMISSTKVRVYRIPEKVIQSIYNYIKREGLVDYITPSQVSKALGVPIKIASRGLRILWLMGLLDRGEGGYSLRSS